MTPRSLFSIIIKVIAIYLIVDSLTFIPQFLISFTYLFQSGNTGFSAGDLVTLIIRIIIILACYMFFFWFSLFKTDWIIDKLHLDQGFPEEKFEINIHRSSVLKIAVIVIGAVLIIDSFPLLCKQLLFFFPPNDPYMHLNQNPASGWAAYYFVKVFIGFSLISANRPIVNYIERKRRGATKVTEPTSLKE